MATITASLERSLQNCSLNQTTTATTTRSRHGSGDGSGGGIGGVLGRSSFSDMPETLNYRQNQSLNRPSNDDSVTHSNASSSDDNSTFVELNSHVSLPYHWEQCLDLKTGELYYINWSNGVKAKEDPRTTATGYNGDYFSEDEDDEDEEDEDEDEDGDSNCYDSEGSSTESSSCSSNRKSKFRSIKKQPPQQISQDLVLVVAGCKCCLMYYMVPKHVEDCPKCSGQLLHFAANNSSS